MNYINNMKTIYTVYQLNEKRNKLGNPYIGFTENLIARARSWKYKLKLDYIPELIELHTDTSAQRAFDWEQDKRVETGWRRERPLRHLRTITKKAAIAPRSNKQIVHIKLLSQSGIGGKIGGKISGKISNLVERTCIHCNKTIKGPNYFKWHGDKCKFK